MWGCGAARSSVQNMLHLAATNRLLLRHVPTLCPTPPSCNAACCWQPLPCPHHSQGGHRRAQAHGPAQQARPPPDALVPAQPVHSGRPHRRPAVQPPAPSPQQRRPQPHHPAAPAAAAASLPLRQWGRWRQGAVRGAVGGSQSCVTRAVPPPPAPPHPLAALCACQGLWPCGGAFILQVGCCCRCWGC